MEFYQFWTNPVLPAPSCIILVHLDYYWFQTHRYNRYKFLLMHKKCTLVWSLPHIPDQDLKPHHTVYAHNLF